MNGEAEAVVLPADPQAELLERARHRDTEAIAQLLMTHELELRQWVRHARGGRSHPGRGDSDLVSSIMGRIVEIGLRGEIDADNSREFLGYIRRIAYNHVVDRMRSDGAERRGAGRVAPLDSDPHGEGDPASPGLGPLLALEREESLEWTVGIVSRALAGMSHQRQALFFASLDEDRTLKALIRDHGEDPDQPRVYSRWKKRAQQARLELQARCRALGLVGDKKTAGEQR